MRKIYNFLRKRLKSLRSKYYTFVSLRGITHGEGVKCNYRCSFTKETIIGNGCHFNGTDIDGKGRVIIGDHFHSGKGIRMMTTFHNYEHGNALPYDDTFCTKDIIIGENVWLGEGVYILAGVTIGEGAVIQARSVVCKDIPPLAIAGGHPAVPFKYRNKEHYETLKAAKRFS